MTQSSGEPAATAGGAPDFEMTDTALTNSVALTTWYGTGDHYVLAVVDLESITTSDTTTIYYNMPLFQDSVTYVGIYFWMDGDTPKVGLYEYDSTGNTRQAVTSLAASTGRVVVQGRKSGTVLEIKVGSGSWVASGTACSATNSAAVNSGLSIGAALGPAVLLLQLRRVALNPR